MASREPSAARVRLCDHQFEPGECPHIGCSHGRSAAPAHLPGCRPDEGWCLKDCPRWEAFEAASISAAHVSGESPEVVPAADAARRHLLIRETREEFVYDPVRLAQEFGVTTADEVIELFEKHDGSTFGDDLFYDTTNLSVGLTLEVRDDDA